MKNKHKVNDYTQFPWCRLVVNTTSTVISLNFISTTWDYCSQRFSEVSYLVTMVTLLVFTCVYLCTVQHMCLLVYCTAHVYLCSRYHGYFLSCNDYCFFYRYHGYLLLILLSNMVTSYTVSMTVVWLNLQQEVANTLINKLAIYYNKCSV